MKHWARHLIFERGWSPQEIEFTFEGSSAGQIYLLQSRDMAIRESEKVALFDPDGLRPEKFLAHGIGVSGGAMTGRLVFSIEEIEKWRALEPERHLILARNDTAPDDIREIFAADGLLTARGGLTSHASVVAHQLGKTCVVGCADLVCDEKEKRCMFRNAVLLSGDEISIDGQEGSVYLGYMKIRKT
jgi:pyruvate,orthophosphate dikinase